MDESTAKFFAFLERQNAAIAAREASREVELDQVRLQREVERREKWGQLRAREKPSHRPRRTRTLYGHSDLSHDD